MKKLLVLFLLLSFVLGYSQVEEFQKADDVYNKKIKTLLKKFPKETVERYKQEQLILDEKVLSYNKTLEKISLEEQKGITEYPPPSNPPVTKQPEFELGEEQFKALLRSAYSENLTLLDIQKNFSYTARLIVAVDSKGYVYDAKVKGKNAVISTFILAAFHKIKNKGKWKPAEANGRPMLYAFICPVTINFVLKEEEY